MTTPTPAETGTPASPRGRWCYWIPAEPYDERGWVPSVVREDEPGHQPLTGNGAWAQPWFWGVTYEAARTLAADENARRGITPEAAAAIVASSIRAGSPAARS